MLNQKLDVILESAYNNSIQNYTNNALLQESSDHAIISGQRFITESVVHLRSLMIEENLVQNVKDNLLGYATAAGLGAGGLYAYNKMNEPNIYDTIKNGATQIAEGLKKDFPQEPVPAVNPQTGLPIMESSLNIYEEAIATVLPLVMENTGENIKSKIIARTILENGSINLEEADFICNLVDQVLTESVSEFIPDEIEVDDEDGMEVEDDMELFDADGNKFIYSNGMLIPDSGEVEEPVAPEEPVEEPVEPEEPVEEPVAPEEEPVEEPAAEEEPAAQEEPVEEVEPEEALVTDEPQEMEPIVDLPPVEEENEDDKKPVEESTIITVPNSPNSPITLITENSDVVARILAKMQA
jgi:hypothetical protein